MTFQEALIKLNISDFADRIWNSNSHGELFPCADYIYIAEHLSEKSIKEFRPWFVAVVQEAEELWDRPESVFQHVLKMMVGK